MKSFPEDAPAEPPRTPDKPWTKTFLSHPVPFKPGTHFLYNASATYIASAIVQTVTGETVLDYLRRRLVEPLGIEHPIWETSPQGISAGGFGPTKELELVAALGASVGSTFGMLRRQAQHNLRHWDLLLDVKLFCRIVEFSNVINEVGLQVTQELLCCFKLFAELRIRQETANGV